MYIELTGEHLSKGMHLYVRVGDQVQRIETGIVDQGDGTEVIVFEMPI